MKKQLLKNPIFLLIFLVLIFLSAFYNELFFNPNSYLFNTQGDAIKNYFTYISCVENKEFLNSNIMNYPYGENIIFLDSNPILSTVLKVLNMFFPSISNYSVGIYNLSMLLSIVICAIFVYLILLEFKVGKYFALLCAFGIAIINPQLFRMTGHFALSYSFFIPLVWYLFIRFYKNKNKLKWSIFLFANNLFWFFIHPYCGLISCTFITLLFFCDFLFFNKKKYLKKRIIYLFLQSILPVLCFFILSKTIDNHILRGNSDYGLFHYKSSFTSIFLPHTPIFKNLFSNIERSSYEGFAYIGIGTILCMILFLLNRVLSIFNKKMIDDKMFLRQKHLKTAMLSAILIFIISMGINSKIFFLVKMFPVLENFRAIGRFAWVFFYVFTILASYYAYLIYKNNNKIVPILFALLIPISFTVEGIPQHLAVKKSLGEYANVFKKTEIKKNIKDGLSVIKNKKYQAIIPLPFFHFGSENYSIIGSEKINKLSMIFGYYTKCPIISTFSSRTSVPETKKTIGLFSPSFYKKEILKDIKSKKPFLIIYDNNYSSLSYGEKEILAKADKIFSNKKYNLYSISKKKLFENNNKKEIKHFSEIKDSLNSFNNFLVSPKDTSKTVLVFNNYENNLSKTTFSEQGVFVGIIKDYCLLQDFKPFTFEKDKIYTLSFWMNNEGKNILNQLVFVQEEYGKGKVEWVSAISPMTSNTINGKWNLVKLDFKIKHSKNRVTIYTKGQDYNDDIFYVDNLLVKEKGVDVYKILKQKNGKILKLFKNNHIIEIKEK